MTDVPVLTDADASFLAACTQAGPDRDGCMVEVSGRRNEPKADRLIALGLLRDSAPYMVDVTDLGRMALDRHHTEHRTWRPPVLTVQPAGTPAALDTPRPMLTPRPAQARVGKLHFVMHEFVTGPLDAHVRAACGRTGTVVQVYSARAWDNLADRDEACSACVDVVYGDTFVHPSGAGWPR